jgi:hypothetical protein
MPIPQRIKVLPPGLKLPPQNPWKINYEDLHLNGKKCPKREIVLNKENKEKRLAFRVNESEEKLIKLNAKKFNFNMMSQYLRFVALNGIQLNGIAKKEAPILRVDRTPKGQVSKDKGNVKGSASEFREVMRDLKAFSKEMLKPAGSLTDKEIGGKRFKKPELGVKA